MRRTMYFHIKIKREFKIFSVYPLLSKTILKQNLLISRYEFRIYSIFNYFFAGN